jgi:long-chain acyl-CoA synthetase
VAVIADDAFLARHGLRRRVGRAIPGTPASVAEAIDRAAAEHGAAVALVDRQTTLSFVELRDAVDRAAAVLWDAGLRPLDRAAVSLPNTADVVIAFFAAMRLGLIWVGINPHLAPPEKAFLLDDSGSRVLVAHPATSASLADRIDGLVSVAVDPDPAHAGSWWRSAAPRPFDPRVVDPFGPAAIAYTSGTTGRPKGAVHSQHNMLLPGAVITWDDGEPLVQGVCLPLTILNMQVLASVQCLLAGSTCVPMDRIDVRGVADWIRDAGVQRMYATPPTVYDLLTRPDIDPADIASLTHLGVGGAKTPEGMRERYFERFGRHFVVGYGLTEAPTSVTGTMRGDESPPAGSSARARPQVALTIRDAERRVLTAGEEGEICVEAAADGPFAGCYTPMLGYWDRPEATATALHGDVLCTGDVGVVDADGHLWVRDRRSDLILRGGANVYPAEVERVLEATGLVADVAVVGRDHARLGEEVVAFVAPAAGAPFDPAAFEATCRAELAAYKVPVAWYEVAAFPRNAMGKVMKPQLRTWLAAGEPDVDWARPAPPPS